MTTIESPAESLLDVATARAREWFPGSHRAWQAAGGIVPRGASRNRLWWPFPFYIQSAAGAHVTDIDGHEAIDCNLGFGSAILGHSRPEVLEAIEAQLRHGLLPGAISALEAGVAERIVSHVPGATWVTFAVSGTEATLGAVRIARASTGRRRIGKFEGGWHGFHDLLLYSNWRLEGPPEAPIAVAEQRGMAEGVADDLVILPYNNPAAFDILRRHGAEVACVIVEGMQGSGGAIPMERDFARELRAVCDEQDILLILDEVITGFRLGPSGAAGYLDITPDLTTLGKIIGGGLPAAAIVGEDRTRAVMESGEVNTQGTYAATPLAMAAGGALLDVLFGDEHVYAHLDAIGARVRDGIGAALKGADVVGQVTGVGPTWGLHFQATVPRSKRDQASADREAALAFPLYLLHEGALVSAPMHLGFVSAAHTLDDADRIGDAHARAFAQMRQDGFFS